MNTRARKNGASGEWADLPPDAPIRSQEEVGALLGVSRGIVQRDESQAIRKLREGLRHCPEVREWMQERGIR